MANNEEIKEQVNSEAVVANEKVEQKNVEQKVNVEQKPTKQDKKKKKEKVQKTSAVSKTMSELKKVSWPTFGKVVKQTGVVLVVTLAFLVVIFGIDKLCSWLISFIC